MKYQNTSRVLTLVFHAIILAAFGSLGFYYGAFCAPYYFTSDPGAFGVGQQLGYNLFLELATLGLTLMSISTYGVIQGAKAILHPDDDAPVVRGFTAFIVEGYIAALFFLANAAVYFDLISGSNLAFIIIMAVLIAIILLIAANIPMVRLYDGKDQKPLFSLMSFGCGAFFGFEALVILVTYLVMIAQPSQAYYFNIKMFLLIGFLASFIAAGLLIASGILIVKKGATSSKIVKTSGYFVGSSIMVLGVAQILIGTLTLVWSDYNCHLEYPKLAYKGDPAYAIMCLVSGVALLAAGIAFLVVNSRDSEATKKPTVQA